MSDRTREALKEKRVDRAARYAADYWLPVNPALLSRIKRGLKEGHYNNDRDALLNELKSDHSLYLLCLRKLCETARLTEAGADLDPISLLKTAEVQEFIEILNVNSTEISMHTLQNGTDLMRERFVENALSAAGAEVMANSFGVDPTRAFSSALLRQLGLTLVAWNYPGVYEESISSIKAAEDLEAAITERLGFSPATLALKVVHLWGVPLNQCAQLGMIDPDNQEYSDLIEGISYNLIELCKVGEKLARASLPERYPNAKDSFEQVKLDIEERLGSDGLALIRERFEECCADYVSLLPHAFTSGLIFDRELYPDPMVNSESNHLIDRCSPRVRARLRRLYENLAEGESSETSIKFLVNQVIPGAGFAAGCLYSLDPGSEKLVPHLKFGSATMRQPTPVEYSVVLSDSDIVSVAYQCNEPVLSYNTVNQGKVVTSIAGIFGRSQRVGVLYLELNDQVPRGENSPSLTHFKALQLALNDCLKLN